MTSSNFPFHFETGRHPRNAPFVSDEEYSKCLDTLTKACTDLFLVDAETKKLLIGKRKVQPQPDWWYGCGGRMKPGETPFESASRILKREVSLILPEEAKRHVKQGGRFIGVSAYSYTWEFREQLPKNHGCADISVVMAIEVTKEEISAFSFDNKEYETHAWVQAEEIISDETKHPALRRSVADYVRVREWEKIIEEEAGKLDDAQFGKLVKEFIAKTNKVDNDLEESTNKKPRMGT